MLRRFFDFSAYLTADEVAAMFRLPSRRAVFDRVRRGTVPTPFHLGRTLLWDAAECERFVRENLVGPSTSAVSLPDLDAQLDGAERGQR